MFIKKEVQLQRDYYTKTAMEYEATHMQGNGEHDLACAMLHALSKHYKFKSILDVGAGTGRAFIYIKQALPEVHVMGVEPVEALREIGYDKGIPEDRLIDGDAMKLDFSDTSFDLVSEFGILHHIPDPRQAIREMLRVAGKAIFVSDSNRYGYGRWPVKYIKLLLHKMGLWPLFYRIKTQGKGYHYEKGDGVAYSYSIFDDYSYIKKHCKHLMIINLDGDGKNAVTGARHLGLFAIKK